MTSTPCDSRHVAMPRPINPSPTSPTGSDLAFFPGIDTSIVPAPWRPRQPRLCSPSSLMNARRDRAVTAGFGSGAPLRDGHYALSKRGGPDIDEFVADVDHLHFDQHLEMPGQGIRPVASQCLRQPAQLVFGGYKLPRGFDGFGMKGGDDRDGAIRLQPRPPGDQGVFLVPRQLSVHIALAVILWPLAVLRVQIADAVVLQLKVAFAL